MHPSMTIGSTKFNFDRIQVDDCHVLPRVADIGLQAPRPVLTGRSHALYAGTWMVYGVYRNILYAVEQALHSARCV